MARTPGALRRLWYNWKMMRLPWRRKWLAGFDLEGNTFWEFKDAFGSGGRPRRILKTTKWTHHGDVHVPPQWSQWLRHTRFEPPTLAELQSDIVRQERMKVLAAEADARWAAKPSFLDAPDKQQPAQMLQSRDPNSGLKQAHGAREDAQQAEPQSILKGGDEIAGDMAEEKQNEATLKVPKKAKESKEPKESPWKEADKGNPGDAWQPKEWKPSPARRRA